MHEAIVAFVHFVAGYNARAVRGLEQNRPKSSETNVYYFWRPCGHGYCSWKTDLKFSLGQVQSCSFKMQYKLPICQIL